MTFIDEIVCEIRDVTQAKGQPSAAPDGTSDRRVQIEQFVEQVVEEVLKRMADDRRM